MIIKLRCVLNSDVARVFAAWGRIKNCRLLFFGNKIILYWVITTKQWRSQAFSIGGRGWRESG